MNICYPSAAADTMTKRPLVILMHGGGFSTGSRNDMNSMCVEFSKRGYVAATIGYRLGWDIGTSGCDGDDCLPIDSGTYGNCPDYVKMYGSRTIFNKLQTLGVCAELTVKPGGDHGIYDESLTHDIFRVNRASCFFKSLFCNTCTSVYSTDCVAANCSNTGIGDFENKNRIQVYPNPSNGEFTIEIEGGQHIAAIVEVYNTLGEKVLAITNYSKDEFISLDLTDFPEGLYFVGVHFVETTFVEKVVLRR